MIKSYIKRTILAASIILTATACLDDLDLEPKNEITSASVYDDFKNYKNVLAKLYGGYSLTGQEGPTNTPDIIGVDEGASGYFRSYWNLQELPTDEAIYTWPDPGIPGLNLMEWTASNPIVEAFYYRIFYQITLANEFIRETSDEKLNERGITGQEAEMAKQYRAEARFLRAMSYWHALDLFGSVPFVTEENEVGAFSPEQISREDLFAYIEGELLAIEDELAAPMQNEYARVDQAAAWTLLTKLYLNAEVYTEEPHYTEAITYVEKVMEAGYTLHPEYEELFLADNDNAQGIILPIAFDGINSQSYAGTNYLIHAAVGGAMNLEDFGVSTGWSALRTTKELVNLFPAEAEEDDRAMFYSNGHNLEINDITTFTDGYAVTKFKNVTSNGEPGSDPSGGFVDTDFPVFRLADVYLMYAEAVLRGGTGGDLGTALNLVNQIRNRAYEGELGTITLSELTLEFILAERARELYWEAHRRTDLIRYGLFVGNEYLWPWKGGIMEGQAVEPCRVLYPIPSDDVIANPNLDQIDCYE